MIKRSKSRDLMKLNPTYGNVWSNREKRCVLGHSIIIDGIKGVVESILEDGERLIRFEEAIDIEKKGEVSFTSLHGT